MIFETKCRTTIPNTEKMDALLPVSQVQKLESTCFRLGNRASLYTKLNRVICSEACFFERILRILIKILQMLPTWNPHGPSIILNARVMRILKAICDFFKWVGIKSYLWHFKWVGIHNSNYKMKHLKFQGDGYHINVRNPQHKIFLSQITLRHNKIYY